jgi:SAM-dependent methyltransferase
MQGADLFHRVYDDLYAGRDYAAEVATALALGAITAPERCRVLEIGAGTGNHSLACARLGCEVTAVEIDPRMQAALAAKVAAQAPPLRSRILAFPQPLAALEAEPFDLAYALFHVVNYLPDLAALAELFAGVGARLRPGASFVFDAWNGVAVVLDPPREKRLRLETPAHLLDVTVASETDWLRSRTRLLYTIERRERRGTGVERGRHEMLQTFWPPRVMIDLLVQNGFEAPAIHPVGDPGRPATERDWKLLYHARHGRAARGVRARAGRAGSRGTGSARRAVRRRTRGGR